MMVSCKFYSNPESLEKELQDIHFKVDAKTGKSGITDPLLFWYRCKLESRNHWKFVDDTGFHDKNDYDMEYPKEEDVRSRLKDPRNFKIKKIKWWANKYCIHSLMLEFESGHETPLFGH